MDDASSVDLGTERTPTLNLFQHAVPDPHDNDDLQHKAMIHGPTEPFAQRLATKSDFDNKSEFISHKKMTPREDPEEETKFSDPGQQAAPSVTQDPDWYDYKNSFEELAGGP